MTEAISATESRTGLSTAALVLGITGLVLSVVPILGLVALPLGILAVIFGAVGNKRHVRRGFALTGIITGSFAVLFAIVGIVTVSNAVEDFTKCTDAISYDLDHNTNTADAVCG